MELGHPVVGGYRLGDPLDGCIVLTELVGEDSQQMEAARMAWIDGKHLAAEQPGLGKSAATVIAERRIKQISGRAVKPAGG